MKATAQITAMSDATIAGFARRLKNKRGGLNFIPDGTARSFFNRIGLGGMGEKFTPEFTIAMCCKEGRRIGITGDPKQVNSAIGLVEYTVFGNNRSESYPEFNTFAEWLLWRVPMDHPKESFHKIDGWTLEFYQFAVEDSALSLR